MKCEAGRLCACTDRSRMITFYQCWAKCRPGSRRTMVGIVSVLQPTEIQLSVHSFLSSRLCEWNETVMRIDMLKGSCPLLLKQSCHK